MPAAYADDVAIVLPRKHCAFAGCLWCGDDGRSQALHIVEEHSDSLKEGMKAHKRYKTTAYNTDDILALFIYNESLAVAIRRGAPLASYLIDRKCLQSYLTHLTHPDTATLICFICAPQFPCLHGSKENPIRRYRVQNIQKGTGM